VFFIRRERLQSEPRPFDKLTILAFKIRMLFDKDAHTETMGSVFDDARDKAIVFIAVRFPEIPKNVDTSEKHLRLSPAKTKMLVPRVNRCAVPQDFYDGKSVIDAFLQ